MLSGIDYIVEYYLGFDYLRFLLHLGDKICRLLCQFICLGIVGVDLGGSLQLLVVLISAHFWCYLVCSDLSGAVGWPFDLIFFPCTCSGGTGCGVD